MNAYLDTHFTRTSTRRRRRIWLKIVEHSRSLNSISLERGKIQLVSTTTFIPLRVMRRYHENQNPSAPPTRLHADLVRHHSSLLKSLLAFIWLYALFFHLSSTYIRPFVLPLRRPLRDALNGCPKGLTKLPCATTNPHPCLKLRYLRSMNPR